MVKQLWALDTDTGECGWVIPVADAPDVYVTGFEIVGDTATITMSNGGTFSGAINHPTPPPDVQITFTSWDATTGTLTITESNGDDHSVVLGAYPVDTDTDTDTFATLLGTVITFADGQMVNIATLNENLVQQPNGTYNLVDDAGGVSGTVGLDRTVTNLNSSAIPANHWGVSAGQLALPITSDGVSTPSTLTSDGAVEKSVAPRSVASTLYNSAANGVVNGVEGMRNNGGALGWFQQFRSDHQGGTTLDVNDFNGGINGSAGVNGDVFTLGDGQYAGQRTTWLAGDIADLGSYGEVILRTGTYFSGVARYSDHRIRNANGATEQDIIMRGGSETVDLVWTGSHWKVLNHSYRLFSGNNWREHEDGKVTARGIIPTTTINNTTLAPLPILAANNGYTPVITSQASAVSLTNNLTALALVQSGSKTVSSFTVAVENTQSVDPTAGVQVQWVVEGLTADYAALGGIASF